MYNTILEINGLTKKYDDFKLDALDLHISEGEIVGFVGENGAGKSTTMKCIMQLVKPDQGEIHLFGMTPEAHGITFKQQIGYVGEHLEFYDKSTLQTIYKVVKRFYTNWDDDLFHLLITQFELNLNKPMGQLSKGMKMKFSLALALSHRPKLLILDEPTSGLDPVVREDVLRLLRKCVSEENVAIFFSSHITEDIEKIADRVVMIHNGQKVKELSMASLGDQRLNHVFLNQINHAAGGDAIVEFTV